MYVHREPSGSEHYVDWAVVAPGGTTELTWSDIPAELPALRDGDELTQTILQIVDLGGVDSYDALRSVPEWQVRAPLEAVDARERPAAAVSTASECGDTAC